MFDSRQSTASRANTQPSSKYFSTPSRIIVKIIKVRVNGNSVIFSIDFKRLLEMLLLQHHCYHQHRHHLKEVFLHYVFNFFFCFFQKRKENKKKVCSNENENGKHVAFNFIYFCTQHATQAKPASHFCFSSSLFTPFLFNIFLFFYLIKIKKKSQ